MRRMSQERIELIERVVDAWNRRSVDDLLALSHPEAEYVNPPDALEPGTRTGHDGLISVMTKQWELLGDARMEIEAAHVRGDQVVTVQNMSRSLHDSPMPIEARSAIRLNTGAATAPP